MASYVDLKIITNQLTERLVDIQSPGGIEAITTQLINHVDFDSVNGLVEYFQEIWDTEIEPPDEDDFDDVDDDQNEFEKPGHTWS